MAVLLYTWFSAPLKPEPAAVRARLLDATFDRKFAVLFGSISVLILAGTAEYVSDAWWPLAWIIADLALLGTRFFLMLDYEARRKRRGKPPLAALMLAGGLWSVLFGLGCYACIATGDIALSVLAGLNVAGVLGVVTSRNAATPRYAILVMLTVSLPYVVGAMLSSEPGMFVVGIQMPFYIFGVVVVLLQNHRINARMIRAELDNRNLAVTDALTGLPNRIALQEKLREMCLEVSVQAANSRHFAVLSMDLDGFKQVNDSFGHPTGDHLLRKVAERLTRAFREDDIVSRVGGDEFVILLPGTTEIEATYLAKRAIETISTPFELGAGSPVRVGLSIGGAFAPLDGVEAEDLLNCSDLALYEAKRTGKGKYRAHMQQAG